MNAIEQALHDSAHGESEEIRVTALAYWLDQQEFNPLALGCAAETLRALLKRSSEDADAYEVIANENTRLLGVVLERRSQKVLLSELYQVLGALGAPAKVLDQVLAGAHGKRLPHKTLLPFIADFDDGK